MNFLRMKYRLTLISGLIYLVLGVCSTFYFFISLEEWARYPFTIGSFFFLCGTGLFLIILGPADAKSVVALALKVGYKVSEATERKLKEKIRKHGILMVGITTAYTTFVILHIYYLESIGLLNNFILGASYVLLLYFFSWFFIPLILTYRFIKTNLDLRPVYEKTKEALGYE